MACHDSFPVCLWRKTSQSGWGLDQDEQGYSTVGQKNPEFVSDFVAMVSPSSAYSIDQDELSRNLGKFPTLTPVKNSSACGIALFQEVNIL